MVIIEGRVQKSECPDVGKIECLKCHSSFLKVSLDIQPYESPEGVVFREGRWGD